MAENATPEAGLTAVLSKTKTASALARGLSITPSAVLQWDRVPAERVGQVSRLTGLAPSVIRPDIFAPLPKTRGSNAAVNAA